MLRVDLHTHSLSHKYYHKGMFNPQIDEEDKEDIRSFVRGMVERGVDAVALTDHDHLYPSLYAREYAIAKNLPIRIITGCEAEMYLNGEFVHFSLLNIPSFPQYKFYSDAKMLIEAVHSMGGIVQLNHPHYYNWANVDELVPIVDLVEIFNGGAGEVDDYARLSAIRNHKFQTYNSDLHYPYASDLQWMACNMMNEDTYGKLFGGVPSEVPNYSGGFRRDGREDFVLPEYRSGESTGKTYFKTVE